MLQEICFHQQSELVYNPREYTFGRQEVYLAYIVPRLCPEDLLSYAISPVMQELITYEALRGMNQTDRKALLQGPRVAVRTIQAEWEIEVPKKLLMAVSPLANQHFEDEPASMAFRVAALSGYEEGFRHVLAYLKNVCRTKGFYNVPVTDDLETTAAAYRVCQVLEMEEFTYNLKSRLRHLSRDADYPELEIILDATDGVGDPIFDDIARSLAYQRQEQHFFDEDILGAWLKDQADLEAAMEDADNNYGPRRNMDRTQAQRAHRIVRESRGICFVGIFADDFDGRNRETPEAEKPLPDMSLPMDLPREYHIGASAARKLGKNF